MKNKFKVGLLTLALHENYGGIIQIYAVQEFLKKLGYETILINRQPNKSIYRDIEKPIFIKELSYLKRLVSNYNYKSTNIKDSGNIRSFINKYIHPQTEVIDSEDKIKNIVAKYDIDGIVVGSDQVWQPKYSGSYTKNLFLDFAKGDKIKKLTYAASFGGNVWSYPDDKTKELSLLLHHFDAVSVREDSAVSLCKSVFGKDSTQVIDPTLLLDKEHYKSLIEPNDIQSPINQKKLLTYILDESEDKLNIVNHVAQKKNLSLLSVAATSKDFGKTVLGQRRTKHSYPSISQWLAGFSNADYVVTDSFHGVAFSIIFNKPFIAIGNKSRGVARFESLLNLVNLRNRLIFTYEDLHDELLNSNIDFDSVSEIISEQKTRSHEFLSKNLGVLKPKTVNINL